MEKSRSDKMKENELSQLWYDSYISDHPDVGLDCVTLIPNSLISELYELLGVEEVDSSEDIFVLLLQNGTKTFMTCAKYSTEGILVNIKSTRQIDLDTYLETLAILTRYKLLRACAETIPIKASEGTIKEAAEFIDKLMSNKE